MRALAGTKETHPAQQGSVSNAAGGEDDFLARREIVGIVSLVRISYAHRLEALDAFLGRRPLPLAHPHPRGTKTRPPLNPPIQTFVARRSRAAFGRAADAEAGVNVWPRPRRRDSRREIAVRNQPD